MTPGAWPAEAALAVPTDVTGPEAVASLFAAVDQRWGRVDLLVNNAGRFGPAGAVDEISPADWQQAVDTNLTGAFLCAHHAVRTMKAQPRGAGGSSTTARSPRTPPGRTASATRRPSTRSPA